MSICKEQFINALRKVVSDEFKDIPDNEDDIEFSFSNNFNHKMQKLIKRQKKSYWKFINTASKRVAIICIAIISLLCGMLCIEPIRVSAIEAFEEIIIKTKNIFQIAYENGIPLSEVDKEGNFKYTEFDGEERETQQDETSSVITGETFADPKTNIYNKMLNTIDFFNTAELSVDIHMGEGQYQKVDYYTDIDALTAYQAVYEDGKLFSETFCSPNSEFLTLVDNRRKTYDQYYLKVYERSDTPYIPLEERIIYDELTGDGLPIYTYRRNITNCTLASYSLFPEGLTYSYLADFDLWEIADNNFEYLDRKCIKITGTPKPYSGEKHNNDSFVMIVDEQTGILLKFEGYKNGELSSYITATKCIIDGKPNIKNFNLADYNSYEPESIGYDKHDENQSVPTND